MTFLASQRRKLIALRTELSKNMGLSWVPPERDVGDTIDHGNEDAAVAFAMTLSERGYDAIREVDEAMRRITDGSYGVCEVTGELIPSERLEVIPFARCTVRAAARRERDTMKIRPSLYGIDAAELDTPPTATA